jgi:hypothetical protein
MSTDIKAPTDVKPVSNDVKAPTDAKPTVNDAKAPSDVKSEMVYLRLSIPRTSRWLSFIPMTPNQGNQFLYVYETLKDDVDILTLEGGDPEFGLKRVKARLVTVAELKKESSLKEVAGCYYRRLRKAEDESDDEDDKCEFPTRYNGHPTDLFYNIVLYVMQNELYRHKGLRDKTELKTLKDSDVPSFEWTFKQPLTIIKPHGKDGVWIDVPFDINVCRDLVGFLYAFLNRYNNE